MTDPLDLTRSKAVQFSICSGVLLVLALFPGLVLAEGGSMRVKLKSGDFLEGRVFDLGNELLEVNQRLGRTRILKREVERWSFIQGNLEDSGKPLLVLKTGRELVGEVEPLGGAWRVQLDVGPVEYEAEEVARVVHSDGSANDGAFTPRKGFLASCEEAIASLRSEDAQKQNAGRLFLLRAGFFALPSLDRAVSQDDPGGRLWRVSLKERYRIALASGLEAEFPGLVGQLVDGSESARLDVLRKAYLSRGEAVFPLLGVLLLDPDQPSSVRSLAIDVLQRMNQVEELLTAYNAAQGPTQLAVAVALGDCGVFIGVPTLLEALDVDDVGVKGLAAAKLAEFTGVTPSFDPQGPSAAQRTAQAQWTSWWRTHKDKVEGSLAYRLEKGSGVGNPERLKAVDLWLESNRFREKGDAMSARELLERAVEIDPTFVAPLVSLGILCYQQEGEFEQAIDCFRRALRRAGPEQQDELKLIYFHLGRIHEIGLAFDLAANAYRKCVQLERDFAEAWYRLGRCYYEEALLLREAPPEETRDAFLRALSTFETGRQILREYREGLVVVTRDQLPATSQLPFSRRDYNISLVKLRDQLGELDADFAHEIALAQLAIGEPKQALESAEQATARSKPRAADYYLLAEVLRGLGRQEESTNARKRGDEIAAQTKQ